MNDDGNAVTAEAAFAAADSGDIDTIILALESDTMKVDAQDAQGLTLLHHAVSAGQFDIAYSLIEEYQAKSTIADKEGRTPLDYAEDSGDVQLISMLERAS